MKPKVSLITLGVADLARSLAFYRDGLGFPTHNYKPGEDVVFFRMEGSWLAIYPRDKLAADANIPAAGTGFSGVTLAHNVASKVDADAVFALAVDAGAPGQGAAGRILGRILRLLRRSRWPPLGGRMESVHRPDVTLYPPRNSRVAFA